VGKDSPVFSLDRPIAGSRSLRDARFNVEPIPLPVDPMPLALVGLIIFDISCALRMGRLWASLY